MKNEEKNQMRRTYGFLWRRVGEGGISRDEGSLSMGKMKAGRSEGAAGVLEVRGRSGKGGEGLAV
ncbi:MAG: hypothetical protein GX061_06190 [Eubacteriaceae bacterium]|nr:hypothetical protein [Eubacteriaceae bacterium]